MLSAGSCASVLPVLTLGFWLAYMGRRRMHLGRALEYWLTRPRTGTLEESRVLRYITEVYGSGFGKIVNRATMLSGLSGCLSGGLFLLADGWCRFRDLPLPF
jgi:hypothetical protein